MVRNSWALVRLPPDYGQGTGSDIEAAFFGYVADWASSRKLTLLSGFVVNAAATALLCFFTSIPILLLSRILQGFSAAIVYTVGFAVIVDTASTSNLGEWMGYNILSVNIGMTISPAIGGALYEQTGYYSAFIMIFSLIALDITMRLLMVERKTAAEWTAPSEAIVKGSPAQYGSIGPIEGKAVEDGVRAIEPSSETIASTSSTSASSEDDETAPIRLVAENTEDVENTAKNSRHPPPLITLLSSPRILADLYGCFIAVALLVSFDSALPLFVRRTFGWGPTGGGLIFITITLPILGAPLAGRFIDKYRSRRIPALGYLLVGLLTALLSLVRHGGLDEVMLFCSLLFLNGTPHFVPPG